MEDVIVNAAQTSDHIETIADPDPNRNGATDLDVIMTQPQSTMQIPDNSSQNTSSLPTVNIPIHTCDSLPPNDIKNDDQDKDQDDGCTSDTSTTSSLNERINSFKWKTKRNRKSRRALNQLHYETQAVAASRHAPKPDDDDTRIKASFEAYIHSSHVPGEWSVDKITYLNIIMVAYRHFIEAKSEKLNGDSYLIVSFRSHRAMMEAIQDHNSRFPQIKFTAKKYYTHGRRPISSADFKLYNVPKTATARQIYNAIRSVDHTADFRINSRNEEHNIVYFRILDYGKTHKFASTWSVIIGDTVVRLLPGHFTRDHLRDRNKWIAKFSGFRQDTTLSEAHQVLGPQGAVDLYRRDNQHNDSHIYAIFKTESERDKACVGQYSFKSLRILGVPQGLTWDEWKAKCSPPKPNKKPKNDHQEPSSDDIKMVTEEVYASDSKTTPSNQNVLPKASPVNDRHKKQLRSKAIPQHTNVATGTNKIPLGKRANRLDYRVLDPDMDITTPQPTPTNGSGNVKTKGKGKQKEEREFFTQVHSALKDNAFSPDIHEELQDGYDKYIARNHWVEASASTQV
jgi:hypothetical protein